MSALRILPLLALATTPALLGLATLALDDPPGKATEELLKEPAPADDGDTQVLEGWAKNACAECHDAIAQEWAGTRHATAWVHEHFQAEARKKRRPESCYGCHIPTPLHTSGRFGRKPIPRTDEASFHEGVTCVTCHEGEGGVILGPWGAETDAHESRQGEHFTGPAGTNKLCANCHRTTIGPVIGIARDFDLTGQGEKGLSCVGCHMQPVERPAANAEGLAVRHGRSHALQSPRDPAFMALAFGIEARRDGHHLVISVRNHTGHRVPGLTERTITFDARPLEGGKPAGDAATLEITSRSYLPPDEAMELRVELPAGADAVRLRGIHDAPGLSGQVFLERELPADG